MAKKVVKWSAAALLVAVLAALAWLWVAPPALLRVGTGYAAKNVCSNMVLAGRDPQAVLAADVQAPGHPLLRLVSVHADAEAGRVSAAMLGILAPRTAVHRPGAGCTLLPTGGGGELTPLVIPEARPVEGQGLWPAGEGTEPRQNAALAATLEDASLTGPGMRAVVVVKDGTLVGERYAAGFGPETPLLGWSMTKTVTAAIIGTLIKEGRMRLDQAGLFDDWKGDERARITVEDLLAMSSGLAFNEDYGDVTDVTRMLFLEPDMAGFAAAAPLAHPVGSTFSYSSGTSVILSRLWQDAAGARAFSWPRERLFDPLGMRSAVLEIDPRGTFVGSSFMYATPRDWARFGQFLLQDGEWNGEALLPEGFVRWMAELAPASKGEYGRGQVWLHGPTAGTPPGRLPDNHGLPPDTFWMLGYDGQAIAIIPSQRLVVLRMGLTPTRLGYEPQALVATIARALTLL